MTNHVHVVAVPGGEESLARTFREIHGRYAQYRNAVECRTGHVWQNRYYSCACETSRMGSVMRYVELNPVRADLVGSAGDYAWSSALIHLGADDPLDLVDLEQWRSQWSCEDWVEVPRGGAEESAAIRESTYSGRPFGAEAFVESLEQQLDRRLRRGRPGRPKRRGAPSGRVEN